MLGVVFVRRLRDGKTYADFVDVAIDDLERLGERVLAAE